MDGSGASGGEGCLGRFRHLRALLVLPWPLIPNVPNSEPELDPKITRFRSQSRWVQQLPGAATIDFVRRSISHAGPSGWLACRTLPTIHPLTSRQVYRYASCPTQAVEIKRQLSQP
jgi:hypothetical protein